MTNQNALKQKLQNASPKIYLRQTDGTSYQINYDTNETLQEIINRIFQKESENEVNLICKGRLLDLDKDLKQNKIQPDQIIHSLKKTLKNQQRQVCQAYVSYEHKLHKIKFRQEDLVQDFKQMIKRETNVPVQNQIILFKGQFLENDRKLKDYDIKNEDMLKMGNTYVSKLQLGIQSIAGERSFPVKMNARNRRSSADQNIAISPVQPKKQQKNLQNKFSRSDFHITISKTFRTTNLNNQDIKMNLNCLSPSIIYGDSSQISQQDLGEGFQIDIGDNKNTKSEEGSPLLPKVSNKGQIKRNIFANPNSFQANLQNFKFQIQNDEENNKNFKLSNIEDKDQLDQLTFNFQNALDQLMSPSGQEVVFCESYYEKEEQNQTKSPLPNASSKYNENLQLLRATHQNSPNSAFKKAEHEKQFDPKQQNIKNSSGSKDDKN